MRYSKGKKFFMHKKMENQECYVAFLDLLGFSNYVLSHDFEDVKKLFDLFEDCRAKLYEDKCAWESEYDIFADKSIVYIMSDSVVLAIPKDVNNALSFLVKWCAIIQRKMLLEYEITVRGGISVGEYYQDEEQAFGKGFVRAASLEKGCAKVPRIILDNSLLECDSTGLTLDEDYGDEGHRYKFVDYLDVSYLTKSEIDKVTVFADKSLKELKSQTEKYEWLKKKIIKSRDLLEQLEEQYEGP